MPSSEVKRESRMCGACSNLLRWCSGFDFWRLTTGELLFEQLEQVADGEGRFGVGKGQCAVELKLFLSAAPFLVSGLSPIRKIHLGDGVREGEAARLSEGLDAITVADAVLDHHVDAFAGGLREAGNFAVAGASVTDAERGRHKSTEWWMD